MHDLYQFGAMLPVIVVGLLYHGKEISELRAELRSEIRESRAELVTRFDHLQRDLTSFARKQGKHDARLDAFERGRAS